MLLLGCSKRRPGCEAGPVIVIKKQACGTDCEGDEGGKARYTVCGCGGVVGGGGVCKSVCEGVCMSE